MEILGVFVFISFILFFIFFIFSRSFFGIVGCLCFLIRFDGGVFLGVILLLLVNVDLFVMVKFFWCNVDGKW